MDETTRLLDSLPDVLQRLSQRSKDLERGLRTVGSSRDTNSYRAGLQRSLQESTELASKAGKLLTRYSGPNKSKLASTYQREVGKLQTLGKQLSDKQAQYVARHSQDEDKQEHQLITSGNVSARIEYIQADVDLEAVEDQREALRDIEQSVRQLGDMMKDISLLVEEQQEAVDTLEHNIQSTTNSVQEGSEQIGLAAQHQKSSRKWMCWLLLILLITALVLVLVFVLKQ